MRCSFEEDGICASSADILAVARRQPHRSTRRIRCPGSNLTYESLFSRGTRRYLRPYWWLDTLSILRVSSTVSSRRTCLGAKPSVSIQSSLSCTRTNDHGYLSFPGDKLDGCLKIRNVFTEKYSLLFCSWEAQRAAIAVLLPPNDYLSSKAYPSALAKRILSAARY